MARKPSHLGSNNSPSPEGKVVAALANMGSIGGAMTKGDALIAAEYWLWALGDRLWDDPTYLTIPRPSSIVMICFADTLAR